jgi:glycosyltransferase involved in cell wall biosynthesis
MVASRTQVDPGGKSHAVIVSPDPSNVAGGVERMCVLLSRVLEQDGWRVTVVGPGREPALTLSRLGAGYLERSRLATLAARRLRPDLLVTNGFLGMGPARGAQRVHVYHGTMVGDTRAEGGALPWRERVRRMIGAGAAEAIAGRGATVVSVSEAAAREVRRFYGVRTDAVIPNGIDTTVFRPRPRADARRRIGLQEHGRYCLFVGRMQHRKGSDLLMAACHEAGYELLIAGERGVARAHSLGILDPETLAEAYAACDCVLFPSRYEACSYVVLEALACEAPLLTTRVGWMPTFLRGVPGYDLLCIRPDHDDIVSRLRQLGDLDTAELTRNARSWVLENNSLESYGRHWRALLAEIGLAS